MKRTGEINHLIGIKGSVDEVYRAVSTVAGLKEWSTVDTVGVSVVGGIIRFRFGDHGDQEMEVTVLKKKCPGEVDLRETCCPRMGGNGIHVQFKTLERTGVFAVQAGQMEGSGRFSGVLQHKMGGLLAGFEGVHRDGKWKTTPARPSNDA